MVKIDSMTKPYNEKTLTRYLNERPNMDGRSGLLFMIFIFPIPFIIGPLLAPPFDLFYFLLIVPPIILLDIWAVIYRFSKSYHFMHFILEIHRYILIKKYNSITKV